jgi:hypothetical protein
MVERILRVTKDTVFKLRPEDSSQLADAEKANVPAGTVYELHSYAYADPFLGEFNGHIKVALKDASIRGFNTWFVYGQHAQVEFDGEVVYPWEDQRATFVLQVVRDTIFKRRPIQSTLLSDDEKYPIPKGNRFELHSYAYQDAQGDFSSHIKISLKHEQDYLNGLSQWFVYDQHAYVEYDGSVVYPRSPLLRITQDTILKRRPVQSAELPPSQKFNASRGMTWLLHSWASQDAQGNTFNNHIKFAIRYEQDYIQQLNTWYVYDRHAQVEWSDKVIYPPKFEGIPFQLPGNTGTFYTGQPIIPGGSFTWGEATKNATRIPPTVAIVNNIIDLARKLQDARDRIGRPFVINSWYRDPASNEAVGGATNSFHLTGRAVDTYVPGLSPRQVANALAPYWAGGILIYSTHVHLDTGPKVFISF